MKLFVKYNNINKNLNSMNNLIILQINYLNLNHKISIMKLVLKIIYIYKIKYKIQQLKKNKILNN